MKSIAGVAAHAGISAAGSAPAPDAGLVLASKPSATTYSSADSARLAGRLEVLDGGEGPLQPVQQLALGAALEHLAHEGPARD